MSLKVGDLVKVRESARVLPFMKTGRVTHVGVSASAPRRYRVQFGACQWDAYWFTSDDLKLVKEDAK